MYPSLLISATFHPDSWIVSRALESMSNLSDSKVAHVARIVSYIRQCKIGETKTESICGVSSSLSVRVRTERSSKGYYWQTFTKPMAADFSRKH